MKESIAAALVLAFGIAAYAHAQAEGGAIVTAGGLTFIAGAMGDPHFRAFDTDRGTVLWTADLPAGGNATPMTYSASNTW